MTNNHFPDKIAAAMDEIFEKKCEEIKKIFAPLNEQERYQKLIELGRSLPSYPDHLKTADRLVPGCQSVLYLSATRQAHQLFFQAHADALISAGLAALLILAYSGQSPETILKSPPHFITDLGLASSLSLSRSNGLAQIHLRMKQEALKSLVQYTETT